MRLIRTMSLILLSAFVSTSFAESSSHAESSNWSSPTTIGNDSDRHCSIPSSASNILGQIIVAWSEFRENQSGYVSANRYVPGQGWVGPDILAGNVDVTGWTVAGIDDVGDCLVVWGQKQSIQSRTYKVGVGWEQSVSVASSADYGFFDFRMAMAPDGSAMVFWYQIDMQAHASLHASYRPHGGIWREVSPFQSTTSNVDEVSLANDGSGNFVVVFCLYDSEHLGVWANRFAPASGWGMEVRIGNQTYSPARARIAMNRAGEAVVVWPQFLDSYGYDATVFANRFSPTLGWGTEAPIEDSDFGYCESPVVSIDAAGNAVSIWRGIANDTSCLRWNSCLVGSGWGLPGTLNHSSDSAIRGVSASTSSSDVFATWLRTVIIDNKDSGRELVANHYNISRGWETPVVLTSDVYDATVAADNLGGAGVIWSTFGPNVFVSQYSVSGSPSSPGIDADHILLIGSASSIAIVSLVLGLWYTRLMKKKGV